MLSLRTSAEVLVDLNAVRARLNSGATYKEVDGVMKQSFDVVVLQKRLEKLETEYKVALIDEGVENPSDVRLTHYGFGTDEDSQ